MRQFSSFIIHAGALGEILYNLGFWRYLLRDDRCCSCLVSSGCLNNSRISGWKMYTTDVSGGVNLLMMLFVSSACGCGVFTVVMREKVCHTIGQTCNVIVW